MMSLYLRMVAKKPQASFGQFYNAISDSLGCYVPSRINGSTKNGINITTKWILYLYSATAHIVTRYVVSGVHVHYSFTVW